MNVLKSLVDWKKLRMDAKLNKVKQSILEDVPLEDSEEMNSNDEARLKNQPWKQSSTRYMVLHFVTKYIGVFLEVKTHSM